MGRPITYTGAIKKLKSAVAKRDLSETVWNIVKLMVRDLELNPDKITNSGMSDLIRIVSLLKDVEKMTEHTVAQKEEDDFMKRLKDLQEKKRAV